MVALPPPRRYLPAANWEEDLMQDRGPAQFLLHFLRRRPACGWKIALASALVATLAMLPGEESLYHKAKAELAQSLRQAAWKHALAGEPAAKPWPWDHSTPAVSTVVPRLGLSAAVHCEASVEAQDKAPQPSLKSAGSTRVKLPCSRSSAIRATSRFCMASRSSGLNLRVCSRSVSGLKGS